MKLNELLGTEFPFIQGGMANIATGEFAAAVSNAGALGLIGAGGMTPDSLRENIRRCRELTDRPFGVNVMLMHPQVEEMVRVVAEERVMVVTTGAGNPGAYIPVWKEYGAKVLPVVPAVAVAKVAERAGADAVIAEGTESGGHVGELTTMALVPQVCDAVDLPVVAAGGIADGRQLLAAYALGHPESQGQRHHRHRPDRRHPGTHPEESDGPHLCLQRAGRRHHDGARAVHPGQPAPGCL